MIKMTVFQDGEAYTVQGDWASILFMYEAVTIAGALDSWITFQNDVGTYTVSEFMNLLNVLLDKR